jgi:DNA-3-methyladenine glycosylase
VKKYKPLPRKFYLRDTISVSKDLLGKILVRKAGKENFSAVIVETEAYIGDHDPASHSYRKITERNKVMYDEGGIAYVYFIYGNYNCFNIVTGIKGEGNAVLIRAAEPIQVTEKMKRLRGDTKNIYELSNGPAKLCMAMNINRKLNGADLTKGDEIFISEPHIKSKFEIVTSKRIGISRGADFPYRFFIRDNPYVTKHKFNREINS